MNLDQYPIFAFIRLEKRAVVKGFIVSALVVFPFTFLPVFHGDAPLLSRLAERLPVSILYAVGAGLLVVLAALVQNASSLRVKTRFFATPAFRSLGFQYRTAGHDTIDRELDLYLVGWYGDTFYRVGIHIDPDEKEQYSIMVTPLSGDGLADKNPEHRRALRARLKREYTISNIGGHPTILLPVEEGQLQDPAYLTKFLSVIDARVAPARLG